jgi:hypothetical protein
MGYHSAIMSNASATRVPPRSSTVIWGSLERQRFLKLPKTFAFLGRYDNRVGAEIQPRHLLLIIALACRKFGDQPIRAYWRDIATGLGVRTDTLRRWAYELRDLGLLNITTRSSALGRNGPNEFDIGPFVALLEQADGAWQEKQAQRRSLEQTT